MSAEGFRSSVYDDLWLRLCGPAPLGPPPVGVGDYFGGVVVCGGQMKTFMGEGGKRGAVRSIYRPVSEGLGGKSEGDLIIGSLSGAKEASVDVM